MRTNRAFTLVELVVILGTLAALAIVLSPAMARTQRSTRSLECMDNNRQLCNAWRMYAEDSQDRLVYSSEASPTGNNPLNKFAWVRDLVDFNPNNRGNWDASVLTQSPLYPYCRNVALWRCPSDNSSVLVSGVPKPRIRTFSMNLYLGGFAGTDGGWPSVSAYRIYLKTSELSAPPPAKIFVLLDMRPDVVNWGNFMTDMAGYPSSAGTYQLADLPGLAHNRACSFSFADNHVEMKRWRDPRTTPIQAYTGAAIPSPGNVDVAWLQEHSTRPK